MIFTPEVLAAMTRLYEGGDWSLKALGEQFHAHPQTVRRALAKAGVTIRNRGGRMRPHTPEEDRVEEIDWLYWGLGLSTRETADRMGLQESTLHYRMMRHGIPRRDPSEAMKKRWQRAPADAELRRKLAASAKRQWEDGRCGLPYAPREARR